MLIVGGIIPRIGDDDVLVADLDRDPAAGAAVQLARQRPREPHLPAVEVVAVQALSAVRETHRKLCHPAHTSGSRGLDSRSRDVRLSVGREP